jgi:hypothetical protein
MSHCPYIGDFIRNGLPEYYGRCDVLYQTDYTRPIDRLPFFQTTPNRNTPEYNERMIQFNREAKAYWRQHDRDRLEAARISQMTKDEVSTALEEIERWQTK